jgi:chromosome partitioning protein
MGKIVSLVNQKGGVAKTTTAVNLAACLAHMGKNILLADLDPQGNATGGLGINRREIECCVYDVLIHGAPLSAVIIASSFPRLDILPATISLAGAEIELVSALSRESKLKRALKDGVGKYDYIFIDCPPSLGLLTLNALTASDSIIVPLQCEYYALEGVSQLQNTYDLVRRHLNQSLTLEGVLLTMFDPRTNLSSQVMDEAVAYFKDKVFKTVIPRNVRLSEAPSHGLPIIHYDAKSKGAEVYSLFAQEFLAKNN